MTNEDFENGRKFTGLEVTIFGLSDNIINGLGRKNTEIRETLQSLLKNTYTQYAALVEQYNVPPDEAFSQIKDRYDEAMRFPDRLTVRIEPIMGPMN